MSTLSFIERETIYRLFGIQEGFVFIWWARQGKYNKNKTKDLIQDACGINIYDDEEFQCLSQQKCVEKIWDECSPQIVAKLLTALCDYFCFGMAGCSWNDEDQRDYNEVQEIIKRLTAMQSVELPEPQLGDLQLIVDDIRKNITAGTPELVIDRLHTFATQYIRDICQKHTIATKDDKGNYYSLDGIVGRLKNWYRDNNYFESEFCVVALQNSITIFTKFNELRNENSAAHPKPLLKKAEAEYAIKIIADTLIFIDKIEKAQDDALEDDIHWDINDMNYVLEELPF